MKFVFNINTLFLSVLGLFIGYNLVSYYLTAKNTYQPPIGALPVPIQVGKSKIYVSKDRDASMATEYIRRKTIIATNVCRPKDPKFGFWNKYSTNGTLESFFLTSIYNERPRDLLFDGNDAYAENEFVLDGVGSGFIVDGGYADTEYCLVE